MAETESKNSIQVIVRMMALFDQLSLHPEAVALKTLALGSGLHPSTAHRILTAMDVPADLREIAILAVARATGSVYEWTQPVVIGRACGMTEAQIEALAADRDDDASLGEAGRLAVRAARESARDHKVSPATLTALRVAVGDRQAVELLHTIGFYTYVSIFLQTTGVDVDQLDPAGWTKMKGREEGDF